MGFKFVLLFYSIYLAGIATFLVILSESFSMKTYFSDNSLLPGLANREFSLGTETEYYLKDLQRLSTSYREETTSFTTNPAVANFIKDELENFGLDVFKQEFGFLKDGIQVNGTNIYSIIRGERSTNTESLTLCIPYKSNSLPAVALGISMAKYFSTKNYWAKDVIIFFADLEEAGTSAWLKSYYGIGLKSQILKSTKMHKSSAFHDQLLDVSGPMQAAIILDLNGREFTRLNIKIQGTYGQLPNLDLFNLAVELSARESITPYFLNKTMPFDLSRIEEYLYHYLETAITFMKNQATMSSDGLHGLFLQHSVQSLTLQADEFKSNTRQSLVMTSSLLNMGRFLESIFRSLNNLTERFNRSYYFYIILSLRRFTSIGFYMSAFGIIVSPVIIRAYLINLDRIKEGKWTGFRELILLSIALTLSLISTYNISLAMILAVVIVPFTILV